MWHAGWEVPFSTFKISYCGIYAVPQLNLEKCIKSLIHFKNKCSEGKKF